jgi:hypothetical protein
VISGVGIAIGDGVTLGAAVTVGVGVTPCVGVGDGAGDEIVNVAEALPE